MLQLDNWRARQPIKNAGVATFFDQMNQTLDYTEDKTTRETNKKRKEMEKSPFYNIYTSVDLTPQEAFDLDVKLDWPEASCLEKSHDTRKRLLGLTEQVSAEFRFCRRNNKTYQKASTIEFETILNARSRKYETVAVINEDGLFIVHDVFEKPIMEIINQFLSDPVNYLQNRGKALGK